MVYMGWHCCGATPTTKQHADTARSAALMPGEDCPAPCLECGTCCPHPPKAHGLFGCMVVVSDGDYLNEPFDYCPCQEPRQ